MEVIADLIVSEKYQRRAGTTFRSVAIKPPWAYVLDRDGSLFVFPIPGKAQPVEPSPITIVKDAGDGNDLKVVGQVLLCTRDGGIEAYSLKTPEKPKRMGLFGPEGEHAYRSQSLAIEGKRAFLLGRDAILAYDLSDPERPKCVSVLRTGRFGWTGCVAGRYLYVGEIHVERGDREGIAVTTLPISATSGWSDSRLLGLRLIIFSHFPETACSPARTMIPDSVFGLAGRSTATPRSSASASPHSPSCSRSSQTAGGERRRFCRANAGRFSSVTAACSTSPAI